MNILLRILFFLLIILNNFLYSQNSFNAIYDASFFRITKFYSIERINSYDKYIFTQLGLNYNPNIFDTNLSGSILRYNKNANEWYHPFARFLRAIWCTRTLPFYLYCNPLTTFAMSPMDTLAVMRNGYAYCGGIDGSEGIHATENGGLNYYSSYNEYLGGSGCKGLDILTFFPGLSEYYMAVQPISSLYTIIFRDGFRIDSLRYIRSAYRGGFLKINPFVTSNVFLVGDSSMFLSTNSGSNFIRLNIPPLNQMVFSKLDSSIFGINSHQVFKSTNNGFNWSFITLIDSLYAIDFSPINSNVLYLGGKSGLYTSTSGGQSFNLYNNAFTPSKKVIGVSKDSTNGDTIIVCTDYKVYKVWSNEIINSVIQISGNIPFQFNLYQNYPNPFNPSTKINFDIAKSSFVKLVVYDALGRVAAELVNEQLNSGSYSYEWNAEQYPSGVYFYKLNVTANNSVYTDTKKMLLIK